MARDSLFSAELGAFAGEIAGWCGATLAAGADPGRVIRDVAALDQRGPGDLTFLDNPRYLGVQATRAGAALVSPRYADARHELRGAHHAEPYRAMATVMTRLYPDGVEAGIRLSARTGVSSAPMFILRRGSNRA